VVRWQVTTFLSDLIKLEWAFDKLFLRFKASCGYVVIDWF